VRVRSIAGFVGAGALALGLAACGGGGGGGGGGGTVSGTSLTIYSSLPLQGASRPQSEATVNGERLALKTKAPGGKLGKYTVKYVSLDDSTAQAGKWEPGQTSSNARKAASDKTTIAYLGEFNSGATAISLPILNRAGILQISPSNTAVGLTAKVPGAAPGEPQKYYPTGKRNYARVVPKDTVQGAADATLMKSQGCTKVYEVNDKEVYGAGLATNVKQSAPKQGMQVLGNEGYDPKQPNYRSLASKINGKGADCVFISAITANNGVQLAKDIAAGVPNAKLFAPDGMAESTFADPKKGGVPDNVAKRFTVTVATLDPKEYPPAGRRFFSDFTKTYHEKNPDPYAIYGFETMSLALDSIKKAGAQANNRQAVINQVFQTKGRKSVLGTYDIDKNGDTTITDYGAYKIKGGELTFDHRIKPAGG
jgi:branched-chain amino acid transport system substrate-binding protein